jgi:hypothetical protein
VECRHPAMVRRLAACSPVILRRLPATLRPRRPVMLRRRNLITRHRRQIIVRPHRRRRATHRRPRRPPLLRLHRLAAKLPSRRRAVRMPSCFARASRGKTKVSSNAWPLTVGSCHRRVRCTCRTGARSGRVRRLHRARRTCRRPEAARPRQLRRAMSRTSTLASALR